MLSRVAVSGVTTNRMVRHPTSVMGRLIRGTVSTKSASMGVRVGSKKVSFVHVASGNYNVPRSRIRHTFLQRSADGVRAMRSLSRVTSLKFHKRTLSDVTTIAQARLVAGATSTRFNAHCIVRNKGRMSLRSANTPGKAAFLIRRLFCGIPTEEGFLGAPVARTKRMRSLLVRLTLSRPRITFRFLGGKRRGLHASKGKGLGSIVCGICNHSMTTGLVRVSCRGGKVRVANFLNGPVVAQKGHGFRGFFMGNHCIGDTVVSGSIRSTCHSFIVRRGFPFTILRFRLDKRGMSVGIRPAGVRLHFSQRRRICGAIFRTMREALLRPRLVRGTRIPSPMRRPRERTREPRQIGGAFASTSAGSGRRPNDPFLLHPHGRGRGMATTRLVGRSGRAIGSSIRSRSCFVHGVGRHMLSCRGHSSSTRITSQGRVFHTSRRGSGVTRRIGCTIRTTSGAITPRATTTIRGSGPTIRVRATAADASTTSSYRVASTGSRPRGNARVSLFRRGFLGESIHTRCGLVNRIFSAC